MTAPLIPIGKGRSPCHKFAGIRRGSPDLLPVFGSRITRDAARLLMTGHRRLEPAEEVHHQQGHTQIPAVLLLVEPNGGQCTHIVQVQRVL
jgi:hypothetical protein